MKHMYWIKISKASLAIVLGGSWMSAQAQEVVPPAQESAPVQAEPLPIRESAPLVEEPPLRLPTTNPQDLNPDAEKTLEIPKTPEEVKIAPSLDQAITLEQALELAKRNNRDLQVAELQLRQSRAALAEAKAAKLPRIDAQAGITQSDSTASDQTDIIEDQIEGLEAQLPGANPIQANFLNQAIQQLEVQLEATEDATPSSTQFDSSISLDYDVFTSGQRSASIRAAQSAVKAAEKSLETQLQQLRLDVANDYYDMQQADELVQIAKSAVTNAEKTLENTQALEQAGLGTRFDVLRSEVQLANQKQQLSQGQGQQETARRQLAQRLSLNPKATLAAADPVEIAGSWPLPLTDTITRAQQHRSELSEILDQRQIAQENERLIKRSFGPQVNVAASGNFNYDIGNPNETFGYSVGGQVSKTLFDGGATRANAKQQALGAKIAETQFANFKNLIRFQVEQNFYTLESSLKNIGTNECAVNQAEQSLELARLRLQSGVGTQLEVSNAETELTRTRSNRLQAVIDYNRSLIALERFVGHRQQQAKVGEIPAGATSENLCRRNSG